MKKLRIFLCLMLVAIVSVFAAACATTLPGGGDNPSMPSVPADPGETPEPAYSYTSAISVYMPDGAPALGFAKLMHDDNKLGKTELTYTVVDATTIGTYVQKQTATMAVLPVNAASKLCSAGDKYKMAAVLTHGNLFVIGKGDAATLDDLKGKVVAVVNRENVPGLTFKSLLKNASIEYVDGSAGDAAVADKVTLVGIDGTGVAAAVSTYDYVVAPEPAVTNVTKKTGAKVNMSLQTLWGEGGYPQAVLVVKNDLLRDETFMTALYSALEESAEWVKTHGADAATAVGNHFEEGKQTTLSGPALSEAAVTGCNIRVEKAADAKNKVNDYIAKIREITPGSASVVSDAFFA